MNFLDLTPQNTEAFEKVFGIMQEAFPPAEYRPKQKQFELLKDNNYRLTASYGENGITAFIGGWYLNGFMFVEHFAVSSRFRNRGIGSAFLKEYISTLSLPVVLEVENLTDDISLRRIEFYKRLGFILTDICYDQPNFQNHSTTIPLRIMYHPNGKTLDVSSVKDEIFKKIYKKQN